jgi:GTP-binding protein
VSGSEGRNPIEDFLDINNELLMYNPALANLPQVVAANKSDIVYDEDMKNEFLDYLKERDIPCFLVSAATNQGLTPLLNYVESKLKDLPPVPVFESEMAYDLEEEFSDEFNVTKEGGIYYVDGPFVERLVGSVNFENDESVAYFQRTLRRRGIIDALVNKGCREGDTVRVLDIEFDYMD